MRWPWSGNDDDDEKKSGLPSWTAPTKSTSFAGSWTEPQTLIPSLALTASMVAALRFYNSSVRLTFGCHALSEIRQWKLVNIQVRFVLDVLMARKLKKATSEGDG